MARHLFNALIHRISSPSLGKGDGELLRLFVEDSDSEAFGELVHRYARLVWGQCLGLLANEPDADDAFQATFLMLARNASSIRDTDRLGPWLHKVVYRVCLNARRSAIRRRKRERMAAVNEGATPLADSVWNAASAALHEEVCRLPQTLREAFVLCCLEGRRPTDAAQQLGLSWGTFSSRLSRAKSQVLERLSKRGFGAGVVVAAVLPLPIVSAEAIERAIDFGSSGVSIKASVLSLYSGINVMAFSRLKLAALGIMAAASAALFTPGEGVQMVSIAQATSSAHAAPAPEPMAKLKNLEELWALLLIQDDAIGSRALLELAARPKKEVVAFLADKLKPLKLSREQAKKLLEDLGDAKDEKAKAAFEKLCYFDPRLILEVGDMLKDLPQGQHRQRVAALLVGLDDLNGYAGCDLEYQSGESLTALNGQKLCGNFQVQAPPGAGGFTKYSVGVAEKVDELSEWKRHKEWARATRALMVLEHLGNSDAVKVLESMSTGHEDASPTKAAKAALQRLENNR